MNRIFFFAILAISGCSSPDEKQDRSAGDATSFRDRVLSQIQQEYPDRDFQTTEDPLVLVSGDYKLGLHNLFAKCHADGKEVQDMSAIISEHFQAVFSEISEIEKKPKEWDAAKTLVRPQFMPIEYLENADIPHVDFSPEVVIGFVLDYEKRYQYVLKEDLAIWEVTLEDVEQTAIGNLVGASKVQSFITTDGDVEGLAVETGDGYDAVRILLPSFREFLAEELGEPCQAAIPNRDFLIVWSRDSSKEFQDVVLQSIARNFGQSPYSLTQTVFDVTRDSITPIDSEKNEGQ